MRAKIQVPQKEALLDAMEIAKESVEGAQYLATRFEEILTKAKVSAPDMLSKVKDFARYTEFKFLSNSQPWGGELSETSGFKNLQANLAKESIQAIKNLPEDASKEVKLDFAINEEASFLRGFSTDGKAMDAKSLASYDKLFNAWLAENNLISQGGTIYQAHNDGEIIRNDHGQRVTADSARIRTLLDNPNNGFQRYLEEKGINISTAQHEYPSAQQDALKQDAVTDAVNKVSEATPDAPGARTGA